MQQTEPTNEQSSADFLHSDIVSNSRNLGWNKFNVECRITRLPGDMLECIAFDEDIIIVHKKPAVMWQELDGRGAMVFFERGSTIRLPRGTPVRWHWKQAAETIVLAMAHDDDKPNFSPAACLPDFRMLRMADIAKELLEEKIQNDPLAIESLAVAIKAECSSNSSDDFQLRAPGEKRIQKMINLLHDRLSESVSLTDLKEVANLSEAQLIREFRRKTGLTPHQYLISVRVQKAVQVLLSPQCRQSLAEISLDCGFADQAHMTRTIASVTGNSPVKLSARLTKN